MGVMASETGRWLGVTIPGTDATTTITATQGMAVSECLRRHRCSTTTMKVQTTRELILTLNTTFEIGVFRPLKKSLAVQTVVLKFSKLWTLSHYSPMIARSRTRKQ